jgi:hypothetical protein
VSPVSNYSAAEPQSLPAVIDRLDSGLSEANSGPKLIRFVFKCLLLLALFALCDRVFGWFLLAGLERYYGMDKPAVVLLTGHSHTVLGVDKAKLERALAVPVAKFAVEGANTADRFQMIRYYLKRQPASVRAVVYDVDAHTFTSSGLSSSSYTLLYPFIDDPDIGAYILQNCGNKKDYWLRRVLWSARFNELTLSLAFRGHLGRWSNLKLTKVNAARLQEEVNRGRFRKIGFGPDSIRVFRETASMVTEKGVLFCSAYIPTIDILNKAEPAQFARAMEIFTDIERGMPGVRFLDYNAVLQNRHELFFDAIHLNRDGQAELTGLLVRDLGKLLREPIPAR